MILLYITIPMMLLGVAIATLPLLHAMRVEHRLERARARARAVRLEAAELDETPLAA